MTIQDNTIIQPIPTDELLAEKERKWRLVLPADYRNFVVNYNGGIPNEKSFECNKHNYAVTRFLCILKNVQETQNGWYDISAVESQIGERLTDNEDLIGVEFCQQQSYSQEIMYVQIIEKVKRNLQFVYGAMRNQKILLL